jgi:hypothetical protein
MEVFPEVSDREGAFATKPNTTYGAPFAAASVAERSVALPPVRQRNWRLRLPPRSPPSKPRPWPAVTGGSFASCTCTWKPARSATTWTGYINIAAASRGSSCRSQVKARADLRAGQSCRTFRETRGKAQRISRRLDGRSARPHEAMRGPLSPAKLAQR